MNVRIMIWVWLILFTLSGCAHKHAQATLYPDAIPEAPEPAHAALEHAEGDIRLPVALRAGDCIDKDAIAIPPTWVLQCQQVKLDSEYWHGVYLAGIAARREEREIATDYAAGLIQDNKRQTVKAAIVGGAVGLVVGGVAWEAAR